MSMETETQQRTSADLREWPLELIRAVAAEAPELIQLGDDLFAVPDERMPAYARELAHVSLEEDDLVFVDLDGYAQHLRESAFFRRFDVAGTTWWVSTWKSDGTTLLTDELPSRAQVLAQYEWPEELIRAVGRSTPGLLRNCYGDAWAVAEPKFSRYALVHLLEGWCPSDVYGFLDLERHEQALKQRFTLVEDETGCRWFVCPPEPPSLINEREDVSGSFEDELDLGFWSDRLVAAVAEQTPQVFRTDELESLFVFADEHLEQVAARWAEGLEDEVAATGGIEAWREQVLAREFRPLEFEGRRLWVSLPELVMWHLALPEARESIRRHGLDHERGEPTTSRERHPGFGPPANYLWASKAAAEAHRDEVERPLDLWQVDARGLELEPDPWAAESQLHEQAVFTREPIEPVRLLLFPD